MTHISKEMPSSLPSSEIRNINCTSIILHDDTDSTIDCSVSKDIHSDFRISQPAAQIILEDEDISDINDKITSDTLINKHIQLENSNDKEMLSICDDFERSALISNVNDIQMQNNDIRMQNNEYNDLIPHSTNEDIQDTSKEGNDSVASSLCPIDSNIDSSIDSSIILENIFIENKNQQMPNDTMITNNDSLTDLQMHIGQSNNSILKQYNTTKIHTNKVRNIYFPDKNVVGHLTSQEELNIPCTSIPDNISYLSVKSVKNTSIIMKDNSGGNASQLDNDNRISGNTIENISSKNKNSIHQIHDKSQQKIIQTQRGFIIHLVIYLAIYFIMYLSYIKLVRNIYFPKHFN